MFHQMLMQPFGCINYFTNKCLHVSLRVCRCSYTLDHVPSMVFLLTSPPKRDCDSVAPSPHHYRDRGTAGRGGPEERNLHHSNSRESVAIFFWSELAAATAQWIRRFTSHCRGASKVGSHGLSSRRLGCVGWALSTWPSRSSTRQVCRGRQSFCRKCRCWAPAGTKP